MVSPFCRADFIVTLGELERQCCPFRFKSLCILRRCPFLLAPDTEDVRNTAPSALTDINQVMPPLGLEFNKYDKNIYREGMVYDWR